MNNILKFRGVGHLKITWTRNRDRAFFNNSSGAIRHDIDSIGKKDSLAKIVSDQHDCDLALSLNIPQRAPELFSCEGI